MIPDELINGIARHFRGVGEGTIIELYKVYKTDNAVEFVKAICELSQRLETNRDQAIAELRKKGFKNIDIPRVVQAFSNVETTRQNLEWILLNLENFTKRKSHVPVRKTMSKGSIKLNGKLLKQVVSLYLEDGVLIVKFADGTPTLRKVGKITVHISTEE